MEGKRKKKKEHAIASLQNTLAFVIGSKPARGQVYNTTWQYICICWNSVQRKHPLQHYNISYTVVISRT